MSRRILLSILAGTLLGWSATALSSVSTTPSPSAERGFLTRLLTPRTPRTPLVQPCSDCGLLASAGGRATRKMTPAEKEEYIRHNEEKRAEEKVIRRYLEDEHGWQVVQGYRLRKGPKNGEVWVTFDEMLAIKADRNAANQKKANTTSATRTRAAGDLD